MSEVSTSLEVDRLAHELAWDSAVSLVESHSISVTENGETWEDVSFSEQEARELGLEGQHILEDELRYLELRGALTRHPENPNWIQIGEPAE